MSRHRVEYENPATGWTDWVSPTPRRYQMSCCDCGLVHTLRFRILRVTSRSGPGRWRGKVVSGYRVQFQARRDERAGDRADATPQKASPSMTPTDPCLLLGISVEHAAGSLVDGVQRCTRCGTILCDYRGAMILDGTGPLKGFAPGPVYAFGNGLGIVVVTTSTRRCGMAA